MEEPNPWAQERQLEWGIFHLVFCMMYLNEWWRYTTQQESGLVLAFEQDKVARWDV